MLNVTNEIAAIQTIVGPAGVSKIYAASSPPNADRHPIIAAIIAIDSGVRAKILALAAGIINIAIIIGWAFGLYNSLTFIVACVCLA